jgi:hypothetical protein
VTEQVFGPKYNKSPVLKIPTFTEVKKQSLEKHIQNTESPENKSPISEVVLHELATSPALAKIRCSSRRD